MADFGEISAEARVEEHMQTTQQTKGRRMALLRNALEKTVNKGLAAGRLSVFAQNYQQIYHKNPKALKAINAQFLRQIEKNIDEELNTMFEEENIVALCNKFDEIVQDAPTDSDQPAWRPSGDPFEDIEDHVMPIKLSQRQRLQRLLTELEKESSRLQEQVMHKRLKVVDIHKNAQQISSEFEEAAKLCKQDSVKCLENSIKEMSSPS